MADAIHWGLALVPVLVLLALFVWLDAFALMNKGEIALLLLLGGFAAVLCYPISGKAIDTLPIGFNLYSRFIAPWIEELVKGLAVVLLFRLNRVGYKLDAIISGFAIGAGFSVVENIIYLLRFPDYGAGTWMVRGLGTAVMHGTTLAIIAASAHEFAERETREHDGVYDFRWWWFVPGYLVAVALHTLFNQFPSQPMVAMMGSIMIAPVAIIAVLNFGTTEAQQWLASDLDRHRGELATLDRGQWPAGVGAARVVSLANRLGPAKAQLVRDYWRNEAYLVVQAEEAMTEEAQGDAIFDPEDVRAAFGRRDELARKLGTATISALRAVLPFSRNDQWEIRELRQRLARRA